MAQSIGERFEALEARVKELEDNQNKGLFKKKGKTAASADDESGGGADDPPKPPPVVTS